jgi:L-2-hydroxyglutarate oxidase
MPLFEFRFFRTKGSYRMYEKVDVVIIGAGVVGLSIAKSLLAAKKGLSVVVLEKESGLGLHASGRNSGVIHAGFYYSPDSLKAKFCVEGNLAIREMCGKYKIPLREVGKVVVTATDEDELRLEKLFERGLENGVPLELLESKYLVNFEPLAITKANFIWSPTTAVSDPKQLLACLANEVISLGGNLQFQQKIEIDPSNLQIKSSIGNFAAQHIINAAGSQSDRIARIFDFGIGLTMIPFMGIYRSTDNTQLPLKTLVYPVPNPLNPFLGVHLTITVHGDVKIGPTAIPMLNREQYTFLENWSPKDIRESLIGALSVLKGNSHDFPEIVRSEFPKLFESRLISGASKLVPNVKSVRRWEKMNPGIRSQLVELKTGKLINDFLVEGDAHSTHLLNVVSPGWTAAIPFGQYISDRVLGYF